jgi:hypothetical protein
LSKRRRQNRCGLNPNRLAGVRRPLSLSHGSVLDPGFPDDVESGFNTPSQDCIGRRLAYRRQGDSVDTWVSFFDGGHHCGAW